MHILAIIEYIFELNRNKTKKHKTILSNPPLLWMRFHCFGCGQPLHVVFFLFTFNH